MQIWARVLDICPYSLSCVLDTAISLSVEIQMVLKRFLIRVYIQISIEYDFFE